MSFKNGMLYFPKKKNSYDPACSNGLTYFDILAESKMCLTFYGELSLAHS